MFSTSGAPQTVWQSNQFDLSTWNSLAFLKSTTNYEAIQALAVIHHELWVIKQTTTEVWADVGTTPFAFAPVQGIYPEVGICATFSLAQCGEYLIWLARTNMGQARVVMMRGYEPVYISTAAIDQQIATYSNVSDAIGFCYEQAGHVFYVLTCPQGNATWVYDLTESERAGIPIWHQRGALSGSNIIRHQANCYATFQGLHIVGDYQTGTIWCYLWTDPNTGTIVLDNGQPRIWLRRWRALENPTDKIQRFDSLRIDMMTGVNVLAGDPNPNVNLVWSNDGGNTWSSTLAMPCGASGATAQRVMFHRLGSTRRNAGLDRIFQLYSTDAFQVALMGAELDVTTAPPTGGVSS